MRGRRRRASAGRQIRAVSRILADRWTRAARSIRAVPPTRAAPPIRGAWPIPEVRWTREAPSIHAARWTHGARSIRVDCTIRDPRAEDTTRLASAAVSRRRRLTPATR